MLTTILMGVALLGVAVGAVLYAREKRLLADANSLIAERDQELQSLQATIADRDQDLQNLRAANAKAADMLVRYKPITDVVNHAEKVHQQLDIELAKLSRNRAIAESEISTLRQQYAEKKAIYDTLLKEVAIFEDKIAFAEMGVYSPQFDFTDSEQFKGAIEVVRDEQKAMVKANAAAVCPIEWTVDGSAAKGRSMTSKNIKITLRAFNGECDAAISNVRWNNAQAMIKRIESSFDKLNTLNEANKITITPQYLALRLKELRLTHEYREKLKVEKEERAEKARAAKEEMKFQRDLERAEEDEAHYERLLERARSDAGNASGAKLDALTQKLELLEAEVAKAHAKAERARSMAERTRSGYVYIISNIGSFGPDVVKIGLTRRLDPEDRVAELGDASVPFIFDVHAMIYSDDAPTLERSLHAEFESTRVNTKNYRKEFFRATVDQVQAAVERLSPGAPFFRDIEAQDYRETLARRQRALSMPAEQQTLPSMI